MLNEWEYSRNAEFELVFSVSRDFYTSIFVPVIQ